MRCFAILLLSLSLAPRASAVSALIRNEAASIELAADGSSRIGSAANRTHSPRSDPQWKLDCNDNDRKTREPSLCREGRAEPWSLSELKAALPEFAKLYAKRPIQDNNHGVNVNHAFALWYSVKRVKPTHIIESGVFKGQSTWLLRQAAPNAEIISLDPSADSQLLYRDWSAKTKYFMGPCFQDLAAIKWDDLIPKKHRASTFVMLDDHQASVKRVAQLLNFGFLHLYYDDNWRRDVYSFNTVCSKPEETAGVPYKDQFGRINKMLSMEEHTENFAYLNSHLDVYYEFPAVWDPCNSHPRYQSLLAKEEVQSFRGLPSTTMEPEYGSLYPPYVKLKAEGLPPPAFLDLAPPKPVADKAGLALNEMCSFSYANAGIKHNGMRIPQDAFNKGQQNCQITPLACSLLYKGAAAPTTKRVLEVGALFGCSTACIASGISDSKNGATFTSADLFLENVKEFESYFKGLCGSKEKPETCEPHGVTKWALENGGFRKYYDQNLKKLNLAQYVTPTKGDFKKVVEPGEYDVIYLDVTHTPMEIQRNVPFVVENFARDGTIIVFDDIHNQASGGNTNSLVDLQAAVNCHQGTFVGSMYVCAVKK